MIQEIHTGTHTRTLSQVIYIYNAAQYINVASACVRFFLQWTPKYMYAPTYNPSRVLKNRVVLKIPSHGVSSAGKPPKSHAARILLRRKTKLPPPPPPPFTLLHMSVTSWARSHPTRSHPPPSRTRSSPCPISNPYPPRPSTRTSGPLGPH